MEDLTCVLGKIVWVKITKPNIWWPMELFRPCDISKNFRDVSQNATNSNYCDISQNATNSNYCDDSKNATKICDVSQNVFTPQIIAYVNFFDSSSGSNEIPGLKFHLQFGLKR
jgi:hypothetical protein